MKFSREQNVKLIEFYFSSEKSLTRAARAFNTWRRNNHITCPTASYHDVRRIVNKLTDKGTINCDYKGNCGRPKSALTETNTLLVLAHMSERDAESMTSSIRTCSDALNISKSSVHRICKQELKLYPYRVLLVQGLSEADKILRCESAHIFNELLPQNLRLFFSPMKRRSTPTVLLTDGIVAFGVTVAQRISAKKGGKMQAESQSGQLCPRIICSARTFFLQRSPGTPIE